MHPTRDTLPVIHLNFVDGQVMPGVMFLLYVRRQQMLKTRAIILGLLLFGAYQLPSWAFGQVPSASSGAGPKSYDLTLVGTVTKLYPVAAPRSQRRWAVVVRVNSVTSGEFSGSTFTFTVHSPAQAGLRVNRDYVVKATKTSGGYLVDELTLEEVRGRRRSLGRR
jgi:hypothetical protein